MKSKKILIVAIICFGVGWYANQDTNQSSEYSNRGAPTNCRALIAENISGWNIDKYTAQDALDSIERNCGRNGYLWGD